jgi:hypothetical protein
VGSRIGLDDMKKRNIPQGSNISQSLHPLSYSIPYIILNTLNKKTKFSLFNPATRHAVWNNGNNAPGILNHRGTFG